MSPDQQQPQQQPRVHQLNTAALQKLYADLGNKTHAIYELEAQLADKDAELAKAKDLLREAMDTYGPKQDGEAAPEAQAEPMTLAARRQKGG